MVAPARLAAFEALRAVEQHRMTLGDALARQRSRLSDERDRALAGEIVLGTVRWRGAIDHLIVHFARRGVEHIDAAVLQILRLSAYQLLYLTRVPASAVVDDGVDLARRLGRSQATGFVNAVLRAISRRRHRLPLPPRPSTDQAGGSGAREQALDYLAMTLSHPRWLVTRWLNRCGFEAAEKWAFFNNDHAPLTLRANRLRTTPEDLAQLLGAEGVVVRRARFAPDGLVVMSGNPLTTPIAGAGLFAVQDESSQLVTLLVDASPGQRVLDGCASPGNKTSAVAAAVNDRGLVVASDVRDRRMRLLSRTVRESGATCVRLVQADLGRPLPFRKPFDAVLVDAPCSGLGTLRRDPDLKWRRQEPELAAFARAQQVMLANAAAVVRPGGRLVYATCSSEPEENDEVVDRFLRESPAFERIDLRHEDSRWRGPLAEVLDPAGFLRTSPHVHGLEAFFGAVLRRKT